MLTGAFRTKERRISAGILGLSIIVIIILLSYKDNKSYIDQAVMAENYLEAGNYDKAVESYQRVLAMKKSNQPDITIGLAQAFVGMNKYDKALEVLRSCYQKTSEKKVKEKIEEITSKKTGYEYLQAAKRAEVYFSNKEYEKAIAEYEKAKSIKSKEADSYKRIAEAYMELGNYEKAREEILEGQALTRDTKLDLILNQVVLCINKEEYDKYLLKAANYISQENYKDGILEYEKAITLLPKEVQAYLDLANVYINQKKYNNAIALLQAASKYIENEEILDLLDKASELSTK